MKAIILSILIFIGIECEAQEQFTSLEYWRQPHRFGCLFSRLLIPYR